MRDLLNTYSDAQDLAKAAGTYDSTNSIDQVVAGDTFEPLFVRVKVNTAFASAGSATLSVNLVTDDNADYSAATTFPLVTAAPVANLTAGKVLYQGRIPLGMKQYHKLTYVIGTASMTAGKVDAFLTDVVPTNKM